MYEFPGAAETKYQKPVGLKQQLVGSIRSSGHRAEEALHNNVCNCKKAVSTLVPVHLF